MPEEQSGGLGMRFRLPKRSGEAAKNTETEKEESPKSSAAEKTTESSTSSDAKNTPQGKNPTMMSTQNPGAGPITPTILSQQIATQTGAIAQEVAQLRQEIELMQQAFAEISEHESNQSKVFDVLHRELSEYKNDFIYEHLKPVVRHLLFLYDSIEQFDGEVEPFERQDERRMVLSPSLVRQNLQHFRDQLLEALHICEISLMERPEGAFDPKLHKALDVVKVPANQDNTIQRVVRNGWYFRGHIFRPAEVVVGRSNVPS